MTTPDQLTADIWGIALSITALAMLGAALTLGLLRAARHPPGSMIVVSLSLLSLVALIGGLLADSGEVLAVAAAGIGALAGAVTSIYGAKDERKPDGNADTEG